MGSQQPKWMLELSEQLKQDDIEHLIY